MRSRPGRRERTESGPTMPDDKGQGAQNARTMKGAVGCRAARPKTARRSDKGHTTIFPPTDGHLRSTPRQSSLAHRVRCSHAFPARLAIALVCAVMITTAVCVPLFVIVVLLRLDRRGSRPSPDVVIQHVPFRGFPEWATWLTS